MNTPQDKAMDKLRKQLYDVEDRQLDNLLEAVFNAGRIEAGEVATETKHKGAYIAITPVAAKRDILANYTPNSEVERKRDWWITDVLPGGDHVRVAGPFTTDVDASVARAYIEQARTDSKTFWIERLHSLKDREKE